MEFPASGRGQAINCPHCGQPTRLEPASSSRPFSQWMLPLGLAVAVLLALGWLATRHAPPEPSTPVVALTTNPVAVPVRTKPTPTPVVSAPAPVPSVAALQPGEIRTNDFILSPVKLEPTPGSSLVYVTGKLRNPTERQRFGVKVHFALLDATGALIGHATDYQAVLEPHGDWGFKAMVMASQTAAAQFEGLTEDK